MYEIIRPRNKTERQQLRKILKDFSVSWMEDKGEIFIKGRRVYTKVVNKHKQNKIVVLNNNRRQN